ncbi:MAG: hypothetical protein IT430_18985 [Phycisphaerales bacterium]|nr:hypothetical protein [Phycisphaerales bacterium]
MNEDLQRIWIRLSSDRRKFSAMCVLAVVGLLLWARLLLLNDVPRTGLAEPVAGETAPEPDKSNTPPSGSAKSSDRPAIESAPIVYLDSTTDLARNFFRSPEAMFPQTEQAASVDDTAPKSQTDTPEDSPETEQQRIAKEALTLQLESLILGSAPAAVINDRVVLEGGRIEGFVLERVLKRSVILMKDQVRVELKMDTPG